MNDEVNYDEKYDELVCDGNVRILNINRQIESLTSRLKLTLTDLEGLISNRQQLQTEIDSLHQEFTNRLELESQNMNSYYYTNPIPLSSPLEQPTPDDQLDDDSPSNNGFRAAQENFPETIREFVEVDEQLSTQEHNWEYIETQSNSLANEEFSQEAEVVQNDHLEDLTVIMWNCNGWRLCRTWLDRVASWHDAKLLAINETWWRWELNYQDFEVQHPARDPYQNNNNEHLLGRPSGGTYLGSNVPAYKTKRLPGFAKFICNGIFFINIYLNQEHESHIYEYWAYIRSLINMNKRVCVMGDFNRYKQENVRFLTQLGMTKVNENANYRADTRNVNNFTWHFNNQIFVYRLDAEMVKEYPKLGPEVPHESPHSLLVFRIKRTLPKLKTKGLRLPETEEEREKFSLRVGELVNEGVGTRIDVLYNAINTASREQGLIKTTYGYRKLKFHWSDDDWGEYKSRTIDAYSYKGVDDEEYQKRKKAARVWWMQTKQRYWSEYVQKCVGERKHFALLNLLTRRGKIWVNWAPLTTCREKRPTITDNLDHTQKIWRDYYELQFKLDSMPDIPHLNGHVPGVSIPTYYEASVAEVTEVLSKKRGRSSPGPSGIRYEHLKLVNGANPQFMTDFVNEQLNSQYAPDQWDKCTVIPLYKANKKGEVTDPASFRSVVLQESSMKLVESVWIKLNKAQIEEGAGVNQCAYKTKHGVFTALTKLHEHIEQVKNGIVYFFDIKKAFGSSNRQRAFADLEMRLPGDGFVKKLKRCYDNLKMNVSLGFTNIDNIPYLRGFPEGSCTGAYLFVVMLNSVIEYVMAREPTARLVLYSDDIACIAKDTAELQRVYKLLAEGLNYFNMAFDPTKDQFINIGASDIELITLVDLDGTRRTIRRSDSVRYLGFYLKDKVGIDMQHHVTQRCSESAFKAEKGVLNWCRDNYYFNNGVRRSIVLTRCIPKLYFGVQGIIACSDHKIFKETFLKSSMVDDKVIEKLHPYWNRWTGLDELNRQLGKLTKEMTKGATVLEFTAAFYCIKPLHIIGMKSRLRDVRDYWLRIAPLNMPELKAYFIVNIPIINSINFRKSRLPNSHLLTALLCGHYHIWRRKAGHRKNVPLGWNCLRCMRPFLLTNYLRNDECYCSLAIPGQVPSDYPWTEEHYIFLRWLNKLSTHEMFEGWRKDPIWRLDANETGISHFDYDGTPDCIIAYTDGSYRDGKAGWGYCFDMDSACRDSMCGRVPGAQTNNRGELYAILKCIESCKYESRALRIWTDSSYSIYTLSMYVRRFRAGGLDELKRSIYNLDLIERIAEEVQEREPRKVFLSKVRAHSNILGNEMADWLSKAGRDHGLEV